MSKDVKRLDDTKGLPFPPEILERIKADLESNPDLKNLPDEAKAAIVMSSLKITQYDTPFPPPPLLAELEKALPGAGERVLRGWELEQEHGARMESTRLHYDQTSRHLGMKYGFLLTAMLIGCAGLFAALGSPYIGASFALSAIGTIVAAFIYSQRRR